MSAEIIDVTDPDQKAVASDRIPAGALRIYNMAGRGDKLYVGGLFNKIGDVAASQIAVRENGSWHGLSGQPSFGLSGDPMCVIPSGDGFVVGGNIWNAGDVPINYVARWNGSTWDDMNGGVGGVVTSLATFQSNLYASTYPADQLSTNVNLWRWTGVVWTNIATADWGITKLVPLQTNLIVLGIFTTIGGVSVSNVAAFDGGTFKPFLENVPAGDWQDVQQIGDSIYLAGATNVLRWNGGKWDVVATVERGLYGGPPALYALAQQGDQLIAAGEFVTINGLTADKIAAWNGSSWTPLATGATEYSTIIRSLAVRNGDIFVGGSFPKISGIDAENVALLREGNWTAVGGGLGGITELGGVWGVAADQHSALFTGSFTTAGTIPSVGIARWVLPEKSPTLSPASWSEIFRTSDTNGVTFQIDADNAAGFFRLRAE
jgi:hypothetical protein